MVAPEIGIKLRHPRRITVIIAGFVMVIAAVVVYHKITSRPSQQIVSATKPTIRTVSALGRLEPDGEVVNVFAPTSIDGARVDTLKVNHGQLIRKGQIIAILDTYTRRQAALQEAQQQVVVAQTLLKQVEAGAKSGQIQAQEQVVDRLQAELVTETAAQEATIARVKAELENGELEARRYQQLYIEGAVSASLRDTKQLKADTVRDSLNEARAALNKIILSRRKQITEAKATLNQIAEVRPVDVEVARAQVAQAEAGVARAKAELDLAVVRSPQNGQVLKIHTRPGELVGNKGIISLGQTQKMVAVAEIYELDISQVRVGQSATITSKNNAFADVLYGKVFEVGLEVGKKDVLNTDPAAQFDARVVEVKIHLDPKSSRKVSGLTNLSVQMEINVQS
ncbi:ABC exporter membrane fusion protein [Nostoc sp. PCC 9305]|uniref:ABC exporter membrane fusion protein n=1 Tax=Nostoc sp. PCC 9305 TaxID=296636 RepID=UPI0039C6796D